jgi:heme ABC exporter ATP-binding subunit CcmA
LIGPPIVAEGLRRDFGGAPVLAGLDLTVDAGELVVLLGANGAGKTTLLRVLATLLRPSGGALRIFGEDASRRAPAARRRVGHVGHESACYPDLTGEENLQFYARLHAVPDPARRIPELLRWAGLEGSACRPVRAYSRGMAQRLALARALLHGPELLLLDEPFSGLDPAGSARLRALLAELRQSGHSIVLSTHDIERVAPIATRVAILHRGRIAWMQDGAADVVVLAAAYDTVVTGRG